MQTVYCNWFDSLKEASATLAEKKKSLTAYLKHQCNIEETFAFLNSNYVDSLLEENEKREMFKAILSYKLNIIYGVQHDITGGFEFLKRKEVKMYFTEDEIVKMHSDIQAEAKTEDDN